jgi:polysaccharide biosynthesis protein VpsM
MKTSIRSLALFLTAAAVAYPAPFLAVGDGAELFLTGTLGVRADDNVFLNTTNVDDIIFDINPGVELVFGKGSITQGSFSYTENISRYSQNDGLDAELSSLSFNSNYDDGKSKFSAQAGFNQLNQNTVDVRGPGLNRRDVTNLGANAEFSASAKSKVGLGAKYNDTAYKSAANKDLTTFEIPVNYYYAVTSKVDLSFGAKYRTTEVQGGVDSKDYFYRVGARGEFSPTITGSVMVGYGQRELDVGGNKDLLDIDAMLNIALTPKSSLQLTVSNDFGVSASGQEQKNFSVGGVVSSKVTDQLSLKAGLSFRNIDYYTRKDDYVEGQLGADYIVSNNITIAGAYAYRNNQSGQAGGDFTNNVFSLAAKFRY